MNTFNLPLPPSADDRWRHLTQENIAVRRLWPWSFSIQKFVDSGEPRPRGSKNLFIASDYSGEHHKATHHIYCFLVIRNGIQEWLSAIRSARRTLLPNRRSMSYKGLNDAHRQEALVTFLTAAAGLNGHLVAIAVDKRKKWLSTNPASLDFLKNHIGLTATWNPRALEMMIRKVQFSAILLSIWAQPHTNLTWITDQDEFVANDKRHDDTLLAAARMASFYVSHPMGVFRLNSTGQETELTEYEDICAIPDLAAGMLSEVATQLAKDVLWQEGLRRALRSPLPLKADIIADWFWDDQMLLRKTLISIDMYGSKYGVHKIWMQ